MAMTEVRTKVRAQPSAPVGKHPVLLDIDASLLEIHTESKDQAVASYKGG